MEIIWHGLSSFTIKGKNATVLIDPYDEKKTGLNLPDNSPNVCLTNLDNDLLISPEAVEGKLHVFDWPGEFEASGVHIDAIGAFDRPQEKDEEGNPIPAEGAQPVLIFRFNVDRFKICHLSNLGHKLTPEMLERVGEVDILMVPVGGERGLNALKAQEVIEQIEPRVIIPMLYDTPGLSVQCGSPAAFLKAVGAAAFETESSFKIAETGALPQDQTDYHILEPITG
ncbi:hypothetical protein CO046_01020 [Candidatus Peregrinibacteria bacterium CG_4_9_14_0_2_um_filter_53_11]|nr:MAG: hypothetical protein CO046_01020 [Candidatus Peregrinibacteria bacterium CG_4_9_14_0_2_um_filter_53_11]